MVTFCTYLSSTFNAYTVYIFVLLYINFVKTIDLLSSYLFFSFPFKIHSSFQLNLVNTYFVSGKDTVDETKKQKRHDHHPCEANKLEEIYK